MEGKEFRLTELVKAAGWAAKIGPGVLDQAMSALPAITHPDLLVGYETSDDAGVFRLNGDLALVQTVDFITPVVDDPFTFGQIAAANSLSDVYAMGGTPVTTMNVLCFPEGEFPLEIAKDILRGGFEKINEAGAILLGGHSIKDSELKYGLSVTGLIHPEKVLFNRGARPGDGIIITKPIGTGIISTAMKAGLAGKEAIEAMIRSASALNKKAGEVMRDCEPHACTDVTGFGLGGHCVEVARGSGVEITLSIQDIPLMPQVREYAGMGLVPGGGHANRKYYEQRCIQEKSVDDIARDLVFDPQTSGGLLIVLTSRETGRCLEMLHQQGITEARLIGEVTGSSVCGSLRLR